MNRRNSPVEIQSRSPSPTRKHSASRVLKAIASGYLAFPIAYPLYLYAILGISSDTVLSESISFFHLCVSVLAVSSGWHLKQLDRRAWYWVSGTNFLIAYDMLIVSVRLAQGTVSTSIALATLGILALGYYLIAREIRVPYFFPKIRWWESNPRYRLTAPIQILRQTHQRPGEPEQYIQAEILDLSLGGCFIKLRSELKLNETLLLSFTVFGERVQCEGDVVWKTQTGVTHPKGVGVRFAPLSLEQKELLKGITQKLKKIAALYKKSRYLLSHEDFVKQLEQIEKAPIRKKIA